MFRIFVNECESLVNAKVYHFPPWQREIIYRLRGGRSWRASKQLDSLFFYQNVDQLKEITEAESRFYRGIFIFFHIFSYLLFQYSVNVNRKMPFYEAKTFFFLWQKIFHAEMNHVDGVQPTKIFIAFISPLAETVNMIKQHFFHYKISS